MQTLKQKNTTRSRYSEVKKNEMNFTLSITFQDISTKNNHVGSNFTTEIYRSRDGVESGVNGAFKI